MNIHEYQARDLLAAAGVPVPRGAVARTPEEAESIARSLPCNSFVVKAQVVTRVGCIWSKPPIK
jgi:succinyl-CoA synthetase beta subunit